MRRSTRLPLLALGLTLGLAACQPDYGSLEIEVGSSPPLPVSIHDHDFQLPVGIAVLINVTPVSANSNNYVETDEVELSSDDRTILSVEPGPEARSFVLTGVKVGETCVQVYVNGGREECIPTTVSAE